MMQRFFQWSIFALPLVGCIPQLHQVVADPAVRLQGRGFSIASPTGANWTIGVNMSNTIVFHQRGDAQRSHDADDYLLTAGALTLFTDTTSIRPTDFIRSVKSMLAQRMRSTSTELIQLDVVPAQLQNATCAAYRAVQVERFFPEKIEARYEYAHHGLLCLHPASPTVLIQIFYTEQFLRESPPHQRATLADAQDFFAKIQFTAMP